MVKRVLVSQPRPAVIEKSPFYELMTKYNVEVDFKPLIKVVGVSLKEFRSQRIEILDHTAVIFTSRTTVDSFPVYKELFGKYALLALLAILLELVFNWFVIRRLP